MDDYQKYMDFQHYMNYQQYMSGGVKGRCFVTAVRHKQWCFAFVPSLRPRLKGTYL